MVAGWRGSLSPHLDEEEMDVGLLRDQPLVELREEAADVLLGYEVAPPGPARRRNRSEVQIVAERFC